MANRQTTKRQRQRTKAHLLQVEISPEDRENIAKCAAAIHPGLSVSAWVRDVLRAAIAQRLGAPGEQPKAA